MKGEALVGILVAIVVVLTVLGLLSAAGCTRLSTGAQSSGTLSAN